MAGDSNLVTVRFGADASGIRKGASEASQHVDGLLGKIKELKSEQVAQGRIARFYASEIAELIPAADGAKQAIQQLIAVGLSGSALGVAIEGVLFLAKQLAPLWEAQGHAIKVATDDAIKSINALDEKVKDYIASTKKETEAQKLRREVLEPLERKEAAQKQDLIEKTDELARSMGVDYAAGIAVAVDQAEKLLNVTRAQIAAAKVAIGGVSGADRVAQGKRERAEDAASWGKYADEIFANDEKLLNDMADVAQKNLDIITQAREKDIQGWAKYADDIYKEDEKQLNEFKDRRDREMEEERKRWKHTADAIGASVSGAFQQMIFHGESFGEAMVGVAETILGAFLDMIFKTLAETIAGAILGRSVSLAASIATTQGHIAEAVAGAAASQAFIPIIGPGLATAAAGEMLGFLEGMTAPLLLSAAGGADLPSGGPFPMLAHSREMMLPEEHADVIRGLANGGGGGGEVHLHVHSPFVDGPSFNRFISGPEFQRAIREAKRNGFWP